MRGIRVAAAVVLSFFVPALGVCGSLAPLTASASFCPVRVTAGEPSCCTADEAAQQDGTSPYDCPLSHQDPVPASCHACDPGAALPSKKNGAGTGAAPAPSPDVVVPVRANQVPARPGVALRLAVLSTSPPINLLNETFRN